MLSDALLYGRSKALLHCQSLRSLPDQGRFLSALIACHGPPIIVCEAKILCLDNAADSHEEVNVRAEMFSIHSIELLCRGSVIPCILTSDRVSQRMSDPSACTMSPHDSRQSPRHPSPRHVNSLGPDKLTVSPDTSPPASNAQYPPAPSSADPTQSTTHLAGPPLPPVPFLCPLLHYSALLPVSRGA